MSLVITAPHLLGRVWDSRAKVQGNKFLIVCEGSAEVLTEWIRMNIYTPVDFAVI